MTQTKKITEERWTLEAILRTIYPGLSGATVKAFEKASIEKAWLKGDRIVRQGDLNERWTLLSNGLVRIVYNKNGKEDTLLFDGGGGIFTSFHSIFAHLPSAFSLEALTDCDGWEIEHNKFCELQERLPELKQFEILFLRNQLYGLEDSYVRRALSTPAEKYENFWSKIHETLKVLTPQELTKYIPLKIIAQYLSMTPVMLSILRRREKEKFKK